jgi:hypothetical protein
MKKFIQICSLLSLVVLFGAGAASSQTDFGADVEIPFAFNIGDRSYEAGNYIVKLEKLAPGSAALSVRDMKKNDVQTVLLSANGDESEGEIKLVFDVFEGRRYLTKVSTPSRTYALAKSKAEKNAARARNAENSSDGSVIGGGANLY